jgi:hypothetical protein
MIIVTFLCGDQWQTDNRQRRMASSGMLRRVVLTRATQRNIQEDAILHSHRRENLKSYMTVYSFQSKYSWVES